MDMYLPPIGSIDNIPYDYQGNPVANNTKFSDKNVSQFNSVFLEAMLKELFKDQWKNGLIDNNTNVNVFYDMLNSEIIKNISEQDLFGLNEFIRGNME